MTTSSISKAWLLALLLALGFSCWLIFLQHSDYVYGPPVLTPSPLPPAPKPPEPIADARIARLTAFFEHYNAPFPYYITDYLDAADQYNLDYRLLPAISVQESQAGFHACGNNRWGWNSCTGYNFGSVAEGIQYVAQKLESGDYYRGKNLEGKLHSYNPEPSYAPKIKALMKEIEP